MPSQPKETSEYVERENTEYVIIYYGTGMSPMRKYHANKEEAEADFKKMCDDPYQGASSLIETKTLMRRVWS